MESIEEKSSTKEQFKFDAPKINPTHFYYRSMLEQIDHIRNFVDNNFAPKIAMKESITAIINIISKSRIQNGFYDDINLSEISGLVFLIYDGFKEDDILTLIDIPIKYDHGMGEELKLHFKKYNKTKLIEICNKLDFKHSKKVINAAVQRYIPEDEVDFDCMCTSLFRIYLIINKKFKFKEAYYTEEEKIIADAIVKIVENPKKIIEPFQKKTMLHYFEKITEELSLFSNSNSDKEEIELSKFYIQDIINKDNRYGILKACRGILCMYNNYTQKENIKPKSKITIDTTKNKLHTYEVGPDYNKIKKYEDVLYFGEPEYDPNDGDRYEVFVDDTIIDTKTKPKPIPENEEND